MGTLVNRCSVRITPDGPKDRDVRVLRLLLSGVVSPRRSVADITLMQELGTPCLSSVGRLRCYLIWFIVGDLRGKSVLPSRLKDVCTRAIFENIQLTEVSTH